MTRRLLLALTCLALAIGLTAAPAFAAAPTITSFTPTSAKLGSAVTITGSGFVAPVTVTFAGTTASAAVVSSTQLTTYVPLAAGSGPITVTTAGGTATSSTSFTVTPGVLLSPAVGPPTATRYVYFSGLGAFQTADVYFDTAELALASASSTGAGYVTITVPAAATPGTHYVTVVEESTRRSAQAPFTVRTDWPQDGYDNRQTATNPYENTLNSSNVGTLREAWQVPLFSPTNGYAYGTPAVVGGVVYATTDNGQITAYTEATGAVRWTRGFSTHFEASPTVAGGVVYLGDTSGNIFALDAATGTTKWVHTIGAASVQSAAVLAGNLVYVGASDDKEYALSASTGAVVWSYATGGSVNESAVVSGVDYVSSQDSKIYALNATTGTLVWSTTLSAGSTSTPTVVNGRIYLGDSNGDAYALNTTFGSILWTYSTGSDLPYNTPVLGGTVYAAAANGTLYGLKLSTGAVQWSTSLGPGYVAGDTVIANGLVYVENGGRVSAATASGSIVGTIEASGVYGGPAIANGAVTILDNDQGLVHYTLQGDRAPAVVARPDVATLRPDPALRLHPPATRRRAR